MIKLQDLGWVVKTPTVGPKQWEKRRRWRVNGKEWKGEMAECWNIGMMEIRSGLICGTALCAMGSALCRF
ncbi:MAG: hypothetical protein A2156_02860 [Deltaproteobacteria bacterium RBG_16_48_10]|nr:MAG: hypothetical protein A2156_02860 [Deltaproteobacteria bacterium RBG_16_48_10]